VAISNVTLSGERLGLPNIKLLPLGIDHFAQPFATQIAQKKQTAKRIGSGLRKNASMTATDQTGMSKNSRNSRRHGNLRQRENPRFPFDFLAEFKASLNQKQRSAEN
jgi:hypothetical protein